MTQVDDSGPIAEIFSELGIRENEVRSRGLPVYAEATELVSAGPNVVGNEQQLEAATAGQWIAMRQAAEADGVVLLLVSGFRSIDYQAQLIRRKLNNGQSIEQILQVVAPPGCSEHHTGRAIDIATPGVPPLTEAFETTDAFDWLSRHAASHGFRMSFPRDNRFGYVYEPWHWYRHPG